MNWDPEMIYLSLCTCKTLDPKKVSILCGTLIYHEFGSR